ncbi:MAG TPA: tetratricopeptide repeat protein, partial [Anaeromyxobacteraceae bacterium]|nr:tetratricopeptide repeat protein [Anaeromyxobacteraceae bacterium]
FPLVLASYDLAFRRERVGPRRLAGRHLGFVAVGLVYLALRFNALGGLAPVRRHAEIAGGAIVLNALPLFAGYLWKLVLPMGLTVFHAFRPVASWVEPAALLSLSVAVGFALLGLWLWRRRAAGPFVAWTALLVPLLPALYIPGVGENPFAERYLYLPSVGFVWLLVMAAGSIRASRVQTGVSACLVLLLAFYTVAAVARVRVWNSDRTLWLDAVERSPAAPIAHYNLGAALFEEGRYDSAATQFEAAVRLEPSPIAWVSLGNAYREAGRPENAIPAFRAALSMDPRLEGAYDGLGLAYVELGRPDAALEPLRAAVALAPGSAVALHSLAFAYERLGLVEAAIRGYEGALRADPSDAAARQRLTLLLRDHPTIIGHGPEGKNP